jgi:lipopolysaccharide/colanic/teichoic acid biosynthesis glycosyltransferase
VVLGLEVHAGDERVTPVGKYLRRFKLDEWPQILNVLLGQMSLVGPRPDIPVQVAEYSDFQRQRLSVPPGLTGLAQVSGNIWMSWAERIRLDVWYIQNQSLWLDLRIIWHTFAVLFQGERPDADPFGLKRDPLKDPIQEQTT